MNLNKVMSGIKMKLFLANRKQQRRPQHKPISVAGCLTLALLMAMVPRISLATEGDEANFSQPWGNGVPGGWWSGFEAQISHHSEEGGFLRMTQEESGKSAHMHRRIPVEQSWGKVTVQARVRLTDLQMGSGRFDTARVLVEQEDSRPRAVRNHGITLREDSGWATLETSFDLELQTRSLKLSPGLYGASGLLDIAWIKVLPQKGRREGAPPEASDHRGAVIDESEVAATLHVAQNHDAANDENPGTAELPLRTLTAASERAVALMKDGAGVKVVIHPGVYRESVRAFNLEGDDTPPALRDALLILEGTEKGEVVISGSVEKTDEIDFSPETWEPVEGYPGVYSHAWPFNLPVWEGQWAWSNRVPFAHEAMRMELLAVDGALFYPVVLERYEFRDRQLSYLGVEEAGLGVLSPGTFAVADRDDSPEHLRNRMFLRLPEGRSMTDVERIETTVTGNRRNPLLVFREKNNLILRNLVVEHAPTSMIGEAVQIRNAENVLVEHCDLSRNGGPGFSVRDVDRLTVRHTKINHNGGKGATGSGNEQLWEDLEINYNNWRGRRGFIGWDSAGGKWIHNHNSDFRRIVALGNYTGGIWWDVHNTNILVEKCFVYGNYRPGVEFELSHPGIGGTELRDSVIAYNWSMGVFLSEATDCRVINNVIFNNGSNVGPGILRMYPTDQIMLCNSGRGPVTAEEWGSMVIRDNLVFSKTLSSPNPGRETIETGLIGIIHTRTDTERYRAMLSVLDIDNNTYFHPESNEVFRNLENQSVSLDEWRQVLRETGATGHDENSQWTDPGWTGEAFEFSRDTDNLLVRRAKALGCPIPWDEVEAWHAAGGHTRQSEFVIHGTDSGFITMD